MPTHDSENRTSQTVPLPHHVESTHSKQHLRGVQGVLLKAICCVSISINTQTIPVDFFIFSLIVSLYPRVDVHHTILLLITVGDQLRSASSTTLCPKNLDFDKASIVSCSSGIRARREAKRARLNSASFQQRSILLQVPSVAWLVEGSTDCA